MNSNVSKSSIPRIIQTNLWGIAVFDAGWRCQTYNPCFQQQLGLQHLDLEQLPASVLPFGKNPHFEQAQELFDYQHRDTTAFEHSFHHPDTNEKRFFRFQIERILHEEQPYFLMFATDVTVEKSKLELLKQELQRAKSEKQSAQEQNSNAERMEELAYAVSHDLREPLRMVNNFAKLLGRKLTDHQDPAIVEFLNYIQNGALEMDEMIKGLLEFSRVGRSEESITTFGTADCFEIITLGLERSFPSLPNQLTIELKEPTITGRKKLIYTMIQHLLTNSLVFQKDDTLSQITVLFEIENDFQKLVISDNGIGMDENQIPKATRVFGKLNAKGRYPGAGMGLAITQRICQLHHGSLSIASTLGGGTSVTCLWER